MSSVASPVAGGGSAAPKQSGTASAVNGELSYLTPAASQPLSETKNITSSTYTASIDQGAGVEHVDNDNDSDIDSVFGDISELKEIAVSALEDDHNNGNSLSKDNNNHTHTTAAPKPGNAPQTPVKKNGTAHAYGELTGSGRRSQVQAMPDLLTFPTVTPKSNTTSGNTATHEEFPNNGSVGNTAIAVNQATVGSGVAHIASVRSADKNKTSPKQTSQNVAQASSVDPFIASDTGNQPIQTTPAVAEEEITTPQRPPATPPRLVNIPMAGPPTSPHRYDGPTSHNTMPPKPDTPLADQLRADFWAQHRQEMQLLFMYKRAYRDWLLFKTTDANKTSPDYDSTAEQLKTAAITAQAAWTAQQAAFEHWKAANPAVAPLVANAHEDAKAHQAAEKQKAERAEFVSELQGKEEKHRQQEIVRYDNFTYLMTQAREREIWRGRVEALTRAQAIIEAQRRAVVKEEQRRVAAAAAEEERKKKEAEAEEQRKADEAQAAEETRLMNELVAAMAAQTAEEERAKDEAKRAAEAQREVQRPADENLVYQALGDPEEGQSGCPDHNMLKKDATKAKSGSDAKAKSVPMTMPVGAQQHLTEPSFGLDQVMASDPFVCSTASQQLPNNGQHMFNAGMPAMGQAPGTVDTAASQTVQLPALSQTSSGVANRAVQQMVQMPVLAQTSTATASPVMRQQMAQIPTLEQTSSKAASPMMQQSAPVFADYTMFMTQPSQTPPPASLPAMRSPPSTHIAAHPSATPSSDSKRKARAGHGMDSPTKRRQSVNQQGAVVPIAQPPPVSTIPQSFQDPAQSNQTPAQGVQTPARNYQTPPQVPIDPALHYGISPPSGGGMVFGTSIKAGICTAIAHIVKEARKGTVFSQVLLDGPISDFGSPEIGGRIKQATKLHLVAVNATNPEDNREAFLRGAFRVLQAVLREVERHGSVFEKPLLDGPLSGPELMSARRAMGAVYKTVMAEYTSPPRFDGGCARPASVQQTPTRAPAAHARVSSQSTVAKGSASAGSPHLPGQTVAAGTPVVGSSPQVSGRAASSSPMQPFPTLPTQSGYPSPSPMNGYTDAVNQHPTVSGSPVNPQPAMSAAPAMPATAQTSGPMNGVPEPTNYYPSPPHLPALDQVQPQKAKKTPARRKSRARSKASSTTTANTPAPNIDTTTSTPPPKPKPSTTNQCIPRLYYRFADGAFYMQLQNADGTETHHRMGRGTDAAEAALGRFVAAAREMGIEECPEGFVFRLWEGVEGNLRALGGAVFEAASGSGSSSAVGAV